MWVAGRRDSTSFGVVDDTTTTKFTSRACAVQCNLLPVVVDQAVVVVRKFPNILATIWINTITRELGMTNCLKTGSPILQWLNINTCHGGCCFHRHLLSHINSLTGQNVQKPHVRVNITVGLPGTTQVFKGFNSRPMIASSLTCFIST